VAESDRLLSDCTPFKGVPRVRIPLSPPVFSANFDFYRIKLFNLALTFFNFPTLVPKSDFTESYCFLPEVNKIEFR
jgi:hypothetical protein